MQFHVGDRVVHPIYGVGTIKAFSKQLFSGGQSHEYIEVIAKGATVWVPINDRGSTGLRKIAPKASLNECRRLLRGHPAPLDRDHKTRQLELAHLLKNKLLPALCETVRDLTAYSHEKTLGATENELLKKTFKALSEEWAASDGVTPQRAVDEIELLLRKPKPQLPAIV